MGMIIKVYVEYDDQEVNITTLNSDNSKTSTVTITSKFVEEYLRTVGAKDHRDGREDETVIGEKSPQSVANVGVDENAFSPMSETDFSHYTVLDSICDDEETSDPLVQVPVLDSTRIKETKNTLKKHDSSQNRVRSKQCGSSQDVNVATASTVIIDEIDDSDEPTKIIETNSEKCAVNTRNEVVVGEKTTATDVEQNMNALQVVSCNVDDFLTSVPGVTKPSDKITLVNENCAEKYNDDDTIVGDMSRHDIVKDFDANLKESFVVDEILASRFNEETQSMEYLLKARKCVPRDNRWRPLSELEKPNKLPVIEPDRLYIQCLKVPRKNSKFAAPKISDGKAPTSKNADCSAISDEVPTTNGADCSVSDTPELTDKPQELLDTANSLQDRLEDSREELPKSRRINRRTKTVPRKITKSVARKKKKTPTAKIADCSAVMDENAPVNDAACSESLEAPTTDSAECSVADTPKVADESQELPEKVEVVNTTQDRSKEDNQEKSAKGRRIRRTKTALPNTPSTVSPSPLSEQVAADSSPSQSAAQEQPSKRARLSESSNTSFTNWLQCSVCQMQFFSLAGLETHKRKHSKKPRTANKRKLNAESSSAIDVVAERLDEQICDETKTPSVVDKVPYTLPVRIPLDAIEVPTTLLTNSAADTKPNSVKRPQTARRTKKFNRQKKKGGADEASTTESKPTVLPVVKVEAVKSESNGDQGLSNGSGQSSPPRTDTKPAVDNESGEFACPYCSFTTYEKHQLNTHEFAHKGGTTYPCDLCDRIFVSTVGVSRHKTRYHQEQLSNNNTECAASGMYEYPIVLIKKCIV